MRLPTTGYLRLHHIVGNPRRDIPALLPFSRTTWLEGVRTGKFPKPYRISTRIVAWKVEDILAIIEKMKPVNEVE